MNLRNFGAALFVMVMGLAGVAPVEAGTITISGSSSISGTGFGTRLTILSLQCNPGPCTETGATSFAFPTGTGDSTNQDSALTISQLAGLGITGIQDFGLVYNLNTVPSSPNHVLTAETVTFYNATGGTVAVFTLTGGPYSLPAFEQGNGGSGYLETFSWSAQEAADIAALFASCQTCLVGKSATITGANDGADSFFVTDRDGARPVPDGGMTAGLLGFGLLAMGYLKRRVL